MAFRRALGAGLQALTRQAWGSSSGAVIGSGAVAEAPVAQRLAPSALQFVRPFAAQPAVAAAEGVEGKITQASTLCPRLRCLPLAGVVRQYFNVRERGEPALMALPALVMLGLCPSGCASLHVLLGLVACQPCGIGRHTASAVGAETQLISPRGWDGVAASLPTSSISCKGTSTQCTHPFTPAHEPPCDPMPRRLLVPWWTCTSRASCPASSRHWRSKTTTSGWCWRWRSTPATTLCAALPWKPPMASPAARRSQTPGPPSACQWDARRLDAS